MAIDDHVPLNWIALFAQEGRRHDALPFDRFRAKTTQLPDAQHAGETPLCAVAGACEVDSLEPPGVVGMRENGMLLGRLEMADILEILGLLDMAGKNDRTGMAGTPSNAIVISITDSSGDQTTDLDGARPTATAATPACRCATTCSLDVPSRIARTAATVV